MRFLSFAIALALCSSLVAAELQVVVLDVRDPVGDVVVTLLAGETAFRAGTPIRTVRMPVTGDSVSCRIPDLELGSYGLKIFHDVDQNGVLTRGAMGPPSEPYAYSNDAEPRFGPPPYSEARFSVSDAGARQEVTLRHPGGTWSVGVATVFGTRPYKSADDRLLVVPVIGYQSAFVSWAGPRLNLSLPIGGPVRWSLLTRYRFDGYEAGDADVLAGMKTRAGTVESGIAGQLPLLHGARLDFHALTDIAGVHGGQDVSFALRRPTPIGKGTLTPTVGASWLSPRLADYYYGVRHREATANRPRTDVNAALNLSAGVSMRYPLGSWLLIGTTHLEYLHQRITRSPIVGEHWLIRGFFGVAYAF